MKSSRIRVLFESFISCGKPAKVLSEPENENGQTPVVEIEESEITQAQEVVVVIDEAGNAAQGQGQEQVVKDHKPENAQGQKMVAKHEQENAEILRHKLVKDHEPENGRVYVMEYRKRIITHRKIAIHARRSEPPPKQKYRGPQTG
ncbi:PREDICTED: uncharacterized protein LOC109211123 [Nicotiana attenuata]|uniref:Uncharacterized protein n=1 Tax=Nicotiana attenuata TaxID=49451 RepID=A0A1J6J9B2_NICAT|nr:PREDICTED: uncharacterized protein LOC109211123 [Nicotiana attenuata]OIT06423.1 hypothetical protein A4A49_42257 [Nicotiana attenuata]